MRVKNLHELNEEILKNLETELKAFTNDEKFDIITLDDGLYSQYFYYKELINIIEKNNLTIKLIFFISTDIISSPGEQILNITSSDAHQNYFQHNDKRAFMNKYQILEIYNTPNCYIGGHGHTHFRMKNMSLKDQTFAIKLECKNMLEIFKDLEIEMKYFAFPYNDELFQFKQYLGKDIIYFGKEREK